MNLPYTSHIPSTKSHIHFLSLRSFSQGIRPGPRLFEHIRNKLIFYGEEFAPRPTPQAGGPPLVGCPRLLIQYIRSYPPYLEGVSSIRNLRTRPVVVTGVTGSWRKLHNEEFHNLYSAPSIIRMIKSRRMRWAGHIARMGRRY
jgi:hypothetical protein